MRYSNEKSINALVTEMVGSGIVEPIRGSKHVQLKRADGHKLTVPGSPSCQRAIHNFTSQVKRFVPAFFVPAVKAPYVKPEVLEAPEPIMTEALPLKNLDDLSDEELEAELIRRKEAKAQALIKMREAQEEEYEKLGADIRELRAMLKAAEERHEELGKVLGHRVPMEVQALRMLTNIKSAHQARICEAAKNPVFFEKTSNVNIKATLAKHAIKDSGSVRVVLKTALAELGHLTTIRGATRN